MHQPSSRRARVRFEVRPKVTGVRVLAHLEPALAAAYAAAVVPVAAAVEARLHPAVVAERVRAATEVPPAVLLRHWRVDASRMRAHLSAFEGLVLRTDVAECYSSIRPDAVAEGLVRCGVDAGRVARCVRILRELDAEGVHGLPVGPPASSVLANAVLVAGDDALARAGAPFVRWVDDWWILARSRGRAADLLRRLASALERAGLRINEAKTGVEQASALAGWPGSAQYHRAAHADALSILTRADAVLPGDGGVAAGGRTARRARGQR
jgi:Reverse transcriptase (RNA-dependent DNA polymerase)